MIIEQKKFFLINKYIIWFPNTSFNINEYEGIIYYLIYIAYHQKKRTGNSKLTELFQSMKKKDLQRFCKTFEHFYGYKLTPYNLTS